MRDALIWTFFYLRSASGPVIKNQISYCTPYRTHHKILPYSPQNILSANKCEKDKKNFC